MVAISKQQVDGFSTSFLGGALTYRFYRYFQKNPAFFASQFGQGVGAICTWFGIQYVARKIFSVMDWQLNLQGTRAIQVSALIGTIGLSSFYLIKTQAVSSIGRAILFSFLNPVISAGVILAPIMILGGIQQMRYGIDKSSDSKEIIQRIFVGLSLIARAP